MEKEFGKGREGKGRDHGSSAVEILNRVMGKCLVLGATINIYVP